MAATMGVLLKFEPAALEAVDRVRGAKPRTVWIKELCAAAVLAHDALGGPSVAVRPPEAEIVAAAAESSERAWPAQSVMRAQPRPIHGKQPPGKR